jgi:hypothetical protein
LIQFDDWDHIRIDIDFWIQEMRLIDIDGDGLLDVVVRTGRSGFYPLSVLLQQSGGQLQAPRALFAADGFGYAATLPVVIDENLDGFPDLLYVGTHEGDRESAGGVTAVHQRPH